MKQSGATAQNRITVNSAPLKTESSHHEELPPRKRRRQNGRTIHLETPERPTGLRTSAINGYFSTMKTETLRILDARLNGYFSTMKTETT